MIALIFPKGTQIYYNSMLTSREDYRPYKGHTLDKDLIIQVDDNTLKYDYIYVFNEGGTRQGQPLYVVAADALKNNVLEQNELQHLKETNTLIYEAVTGEAIRPETIEKQKKRNTIIVILAILLGILILKKLRKK